MASPYVAAIFSCRYHEKYPWYLRCSSLRRQSRPPIAAPNHGPALSRIAVASHVSVVVVEQRIVGGELLTGAHITHGDQHDIAGETDVGVAGVVNKQHHRLVLLRRQSNQVKPVGDLNLRVREWLREVRELLRGHDGG